MKFDCKEIKDSGLDLSMIVRAIEKAVADDVPRQLSEHPLETNNYIGLMRGDYINENLRNFALAEGYELLPIQRYGWKGRLIINRKKHVTISICTQANLRAIPHTQRSRPHYTMSLLKVQNGDLQCAYQQQTMFCMEPFDKETLEADYNNIISGAFNPSEGYRHYFVVYRVAGNELVDVKLLLLDPNYNIVSEQSLNHLIEPDFSRLTTHIPVPMQEDTVEQLHREATRKLFKIKPNLRKMDNQA